MTKTTTKTKSSPSPQESPTLDNTNTKPLYRMSDVGCKRALAAPRLGYEPISRTDRSLLIMSEASYHEYIVKARLREAGVALWDDTNPCLVCLEKLGEGEERFGFHVEIHTSLFNMFGHLDTWFSVDDDVVVGEIKSFGKDTWTKFTRAPFEGHPVYLNQIALYAHALNSRGVVFLLKNRDNGRIKVYILGEVAAWLVQKICGVPGFEYGDSFELPDAKAVLSRIGDVELCVQDDELPTGEPEDFRCEWCNYNYLCEKDKTLPLHVSETAVVEAAEKWKEADEREKIAKLDKDRSKGILLTRGKSDPKFRVAGLSVSYNGERTKTYVDEKALKGLVSKDVFDEVRKQSAPWDDIQIRRLKEAQ